MSESSREAGVRGFNVVALRVTAKGGVYGLRLHRKEEGQALALRRRLADLGWRAHIVTLFLLLLCAGCAAPRGQWKVKVSGAFSPSEVAAIDQAMARWSDATPAHFESTVEDCGQARDGEICIHASDDEEIAKIGVGAEPGRLAATINHSTGGADVWLDVPALHDLGQVMTIAAAGHELGHAMGLGHDGAGNLMAAYADQVTEAPTATDVANWHRAND